MSFFEIMFGLIALMFVAGIIGHAAVGLMAWKEHEDKSKKD